LSGQLINYFAEKQHGAVIPVIFKIEKTQEMLRPTAGTSWDVVNTGGVGVWRDRNCILHKRHREAEWVDSCRSLGILLIPNHPTGEQSERVDGDLRISRLPGSLPAAGRRA